jgi:hypothetical protein
MIADRIREQALQAEVEFSSRRSSVCFGVSPGFFFADSINQDSVLVGISSG